MFLRPGPGMAKIAGICVFLLWGMDAPPLSASSISVMVVETGKIDPYPVSEFSRLWENGLMNAFFNGGHIVTNVPVIQIPSEGSGELPEEVQPGFDEARDGGMEFFLLALLDYQGREGKPEKIRLKLFGFRPLGMLYEEDLSAAPEASPKEIYANAEKVAKRIFPRLNGR